MIIAYLSGSVVPSKSANSIQVMRMCDAFTRAGHEVELFALRPQEPDFVGKDPHEFYGVRHRFPVHRSRRRGGFGGTFAHGLRMARAARRTRPDLVYCRHVRGAFFAARQGLPVAYEAHAPIEGEGFPGAWMFERLIRSKGFRGLVVISKALREEYESRWPLLKGRVVVAPDASDPVTMRVSVERTGALRIGYVGHLYKGKGMELIHRLAALLPEHEFHVVGGLPRDIDAWKSRMNGIHNVRFYGHLPPSEALERCKSFDVLLAPYQADVGTHAGKSGNIAPWMSPLKIFEYMGTGKPIICSNLPVLREVLEDDETALLCDPTDVDAWKEAVGRLGQDSGLRRRLAGNALRELKARYTWEKRVERILGSVMTTTLIDRD